MLLTTRCAPWLVFPAVKQYYNDLSRSLPDNQPTYHRVTDVCRARLGLPPQQSCRPRRFSETTETDCTTKAGLSLTRGESRRGGQGRQTETETETEGTYAFAGPITCRGRLAWRMIDMSSPVSLLGGTWAVLI